MPLAMRDFAGRQNGVAKRADAQRYVNPRFDEIDISVRENDINIERRVLREKRRQAVHDVQAREC
jgi:hypothetical protein